MPSERGHRLPECGKKEIAEAKARPVAVGEGFVVKSSGAGLVGNAERERQV